MPPLKPPAHLLYEEPTWKSRPFGAKLGAGFRKWTLPILTELDELLVVDLDLDGALSDLESLADYNFGTQRLDSGIRKNCVEWYLLNYAKMVQDHASGQVWADDSTAAWLWIPGDQVIPDGHGAVGPMQRKPAPPAPRHRPPPLPPMRAAARGQKAGPKAVTTVDEKFRPGDILLSEHPGDDFIQQVTLSWPTHAGICIDPDKDQAVDAMPQLGDHAVAITGLKDFFSPKVTPGGGLVLRYTGGGDELMNRENGRIASVWAEAQTHHKYHFTLRSPILGETRDAQGSITGVRQEVEDHYFDASGEAATKEGKPLTIKTKTKGEVRRLYDIYCAELVWRAYRFGAGVTLVDPKKFFCMYDHPNRTIVGLLVFQITNDGDLDWAGVLKPNSSPTANTIIRGFSSFWSHLLTNRLARAVVTKQMKKKHSGYLCAPHQFLESPVLKQVRRIAPDKGQVKHTVYNFHQSDIHPLDVVKNFAKGELWFKTWCKKKAKACVTSVDDPLKLTPVP